MPVPTSDILTEIHRLPPADTDYVLGRWHRDRLSPAGYLVEARVFLMSLSAPANRPVRKFLILGRARSGTTLLKQLLNGHSRIRCGGEILKSRVLAPAEMLDRLARKAPEEAYGAKLLSYQMVQTYRFRDPVGFLAGLEARGFRFIHLVRGTLAQTLSLNVAQATLRFHSFQHGLAERRALTLDPQGFVARVRWSEALLEYERACLAGFEHLPLSYEADLLDAARHDATVARVCDFIGVPRETVTAGLRKMLPDDPRQMIANYDEVAGALREAGFGHILPRDVSHAKHGPLTD